MAEKKINGKTYKVEPLLATRALKLQARIMRFLGGAVDKLPEILGERAAGNADKSNAAAIAALTAIFDKADPDEYVSLVQEIAETAMVQRPSSAWEHVNFDADFTGDLKSIPALVAFVLQEQFRDFFTGVLANGNLK